MQPRLYLSREQIPGVLLTALFALFVVMLPRFTDTAKIWFVLLILTSLVYLIMNFGELKRTDQMERFFFGAMIANFLWMAFSFYFNGEPGRGANFLWGRHFYFLFLIPMFFMFRNIRISTRAIVFCLVASTLVSVLHILVNVYQGVDYRMLGMNPNKFGPIQLCITGILACFLSSIDTPREKLIVIIGILAGLATVLASQSKATWTAALVICTFFIFYLPGKWSPGRRFGVLLLGLVLICSSYFLPIVKPRIDTLVKNVPAYFHSEHYHDMERQTSFGTRMELWKAAWKMFLENPVTGVGIGGFQVMAKANSERYQVNSTVGKFKYVHNQYIGALATRGIPGLILLLLVMGTPLYIAMTRKSTDRETNAVRLGLIFISITYIVVNIPDDHFEGKSANMFLSVILALLLARISDSRRDSALETP